METSILTGVLLGLALVLGWRLAQRVIWPVGRIAPERLKQRLDRREDLLLLDVRTAGEFTGPDGHIRGSINVALDALGSKIKRAKGEIRQFADEEVVVVCRTGSRAATAARKLKRAGVGNIAVLDGGMLAWNGKGYPKAR